MSQIRRSQRHVRRCSTRARMSYARLRGSFCVARAEQHAKPDAPCRVRRRVGPARHRHWRAYPLRRLQQNTRHPEGCGLIRRLHEWAGRRACSLPGTRAYPTVSFDAAQSWATARMVVVSLDLLEGFNRAGEIGSKFPRSMATCRSWASGVRGASAWVAITSNAAGQGRGRSSWKPARLRLLIAPHRRLLIFPARQPTAPAFGIPRRF